METRVNIDKPRYDQSTFKGRAQHFFVTTNPLNAFVSSGELEKCKDIVRKYRSGTDTNIGEDEIWRAKHIYDSAFHPDTGEKMLIIGRMSAQVPMNMTITGCMMTFYKTTPAVVFWQWFNQSFNAVVNYTNRSGDSPISTSLLGTSYVLATTAATGTALGLNRLAKNLPQLVGRYVPFAAVAAANCINIPCMRSAEITGGVPVFTRSGERIGESQTAAKKAIREVVISRIVMAIPGMMTPPILMMKLEKGKFLKRYPWMSAPIQVLMVGACLIFATPLCCAIFPQESSLSAAKLEGHLQEKLKATSGDKDYVYFNKGL